MKKLNNKGYMLVEIILASVIAFVMAFFLLDITVKLINKNNDYYTSSKLLSDRNIITKEIMDDINSYNLIMVRQKQDNIYTFVFDEDEIDFIIDEENKTITYGDYEKSLSKKLSFSSVILENDEDAKVFTFKLPAYTAYSNIDYGLNIIIPYKGELEIKLPENCKTITVKYGSTSTIYTDTAVTLDYDKNISEYEVSVSGGEYILESWGAQGGNSSKYSGGLGGFINGKLKLTSNSTLKVKIGGQDGTNGGGTSIGEGSYNGGGATTVSLNNSIIMIAGGGSGANDNYNGNDGGNGDGTGAVNGTNGGGGSSKEIEYDDGTDSWYCKGEDENKCSISEDVNDEHKGMWCYCSVEIGSGNSAPSGYTCGKADKYGYKTCKKEFQASYDGQQIADKGIGNGGQSAVSSTITNSSKSDGVKEGNGKFTISCVNTGIKPSTEYPTEGNVVTDTLLEENTISKQIYNYSDVGMTEVTLEYGTYILETWGAQGKSYERTITDDDGDEVTYTGLGGNGGYSYGTLTLTGDTNIFVYVGESGTDEKTGAFNGGGAYGGGGASDIRIGTDSLYARIIVAGGGGAGDGYGNKTTGIRTYDGGYGGGTTGGRGAGKNASPVGPSSSTQSTTSTSTQATSTDAELGGKGGSQTSGGASYYNTHDGTTSYGILASFGIGGGYDATANTSVNGGGGGFYGGGFSSHGGGGGSGYVYTEDTASNYPTGCLLNSSYYLTDAETIAGNTSFTDYDGTTVTGHSGDGAVRITALPKYLIPRIIFDNEVLTISYGTLVNLDNGVSYKCEDNKPNGCTYLGTGITDTSTIEKGTYYLSYKIKASDGKIYTYVRKLIVN